MLKLAGAVGTSISFGLGGLIMAILVGCLSVVPGDSGAWSAPFFGGSSGFMETIAVLAIRHLIYALYHGFLHPDIVFDETAMIAGLVFGLCIGLFQGIQSVNPEGHGFVSVFCAG